MDVDGPKAASESRACGERVFWGMFSKAGRVPAMRVEDREKKGCKFGCLCERLCV
jgi:hypothetical protein